jgi:ABC-type dipeptide/oligopeptide/nickel transport system permease subunit
MRIGSVVVVVWLIIGVIAGAQRGYYNGPVSTCTKAGTIAVTILAGPLNYVGVNPKVSCTIPQPSK